MEDLIAISLSIDEGKKILHDFMPIYVALKKKQDVQAYFNKSLDRKEMHDLKMANNICNRILSQANHLSIH